MAATSEAGARVQPWTRCGAGAEGEAAPRPPDTVLAGHLGQAMLAAQRLRDALDAASWHHAEALAQLERAMALAGAPAACGGCVPPPAARAPDTLSARELQVVRLLASGRSNCQIARVLSLSPRTVQRHVANAYAKIGAHNKADATAYALRHRLV